MDLLDVVNRPDAPAPWSEGDNIPWHDPGFSERMLKEHLSQDHDAASRRFGKIDKHVNWIHRTLLLGQPTKILDLGCGPGLYTSRLSGLGHECLGIDYSPASISYAMDQAVRGNLRCTYLHQDIRTAEYGTGFGLVMLINGEFNVFRPADARRILHKANRALASNGLLLLEPEKLNAVRENGERGASWSSAVSGLFSDKPHLRLDETFWDPVSRTTTIRYLIIDASTGKVTLYAQSLQAYTDEEYRSFLVECGFENVRFFPSLTGSENESQNDMMVIVAQKM